MLKVSEAELARLDEQYPGIREAVEAVEGAAIPSCPSCGSDDGATVHVGTVGRSIALASATSKVRLLANGPAAGKYFCNACQRYYDDLEQSKYEILPRAAWSRHDLLARLETGSNPDGDWHFILFALSEQEARAAREIRLQYRVGDEWKEAVRGAGGFFPSRGWQQSSADWFCVELEPEGLEWRALLPKGSRE